MHKQQSQQTHHTHSNQRIPKVTHPVPDDDDNIFGSAEDYDDSDLSPNIYSKPTKTSSEMHTNNHHHYPFSNGNNNGRYNIPLFSNTGSNAVSSNVGSTINGNSINGNNGIVTRTEVRGSDNNEVSTATASANLILLFDIRKNVKLFSIISNIQSNYLTLFAINLLISAFAQYSAT